MKYKCLRIIALLFISSFVLASCGKAEKPVESDFDTLMDDRDKEPVYEEEIEDEISAEFFEEGQDEDFVEENFIEEPDMSITLCMVGDILLHEELDEIAKSDDGTYNYDYLFSETKDFIESRDLAIVNQEVILGGEELRISGYPNFNAPYEVGDALVDAGFDVVCHGTNHAIDRNKAGLINCQEYWKNNHPEIEVLGIHDSKEDQDYISILEIKGVKIALLNYTYGTNGIKLPESMPFGVDYLSEKRVISDIKRAEEEADFTIVMPHWGTEYRLSKDSSQEKWSKIFLENGVDLVIGTHPHVLEPVEMLSDENGHEMLVYYSLGNYVCWSHTSGAGVADKFLGGIADVTLNKNDNGEVYIENYNLIPIVTHLVSEPMSATVYYLDEYTEELAQMNRVKGKDSAFSLDYCVKLFDEIYLQNHE